MPTRSGVSWLRGSDPASSSVWSSMGKVRPLHLTVRGLSPEHSMSLQS
jgi:hypothetical protein